jgi:glutamate-5-semialdehyde dehydrogenase
LAHESKLKKIHQAARELRMSSVEVRNKVLLKAAEFLLEEEDAILKANQKDLKKLPADATSAFRDRLTLSTQRLSSMAESLRQVADLPDPLAVVGEKKVLKNGLELKKVRAPLGVIFMIFESRPNVAIEAFSMGFKAGNSMILRGGKESQHTVAVLYKLLHAAIKQAGLPSDVLWGITDPDRKIVNELLTQKEYIDVVVPRGGEGLINFVVKNSLIPIIKNDRGLCHVYVHEDADLAMAVNIIVNSKTQRPAVCNSMETMLIHSAVAEQLLPMLYQQMQKFQVKWFGDAKTLKILKGEKQVKKAAEKNWNTEYSDQIVNCKIVDGIDEAIEHIEKYGSRHSESIVTDSKEMAQKFQKEIDAAVVYWNASTRFTDGFEFGLGGELGISTQKLHVRGPVGLQALTSERWIVTGTGQIRE